jgi:hypothetical protein
MTFYRSSMHFVIIVLLAVVDVALVVAAWYAIRRQLILPTWRLRVSYGSLALLSATSGAFVFHLLSSLANWDYLPRGPFDQFVDVCFLSALGAVLMAAFAKGFVRFAAASAGIVVAYLWILVAAWSFNV